MRPVIPAHGPLTPILVLLAAAALLGLLLAVLPPFAGHQAFVASWHLYEGQPEIRVLLRRVIPGERLSLQAQGLPTGRRGVLEAGVGTLSLEGRPLDLPLELRTGGEGPLVVDGRRFPGSLHLVPAGRTVLVVNVVPLETYLEGVVLPEMGPGADDEALKAQAVASRSYALARLRARQGRPYHLAADQSSQVYLGLAEHPARAAAVVADTGGEVLTWQGAVLPGLYASTCGGTTRPAGEAFGGPTPAPLQGVTCGFCDQAPPARWEAALPVEAVRRSLGLPHPVHGVAALLRRPSGRIRAMVLSGPGSASSRTEVKDLRRAFRGRLLSTWVVQARVEGGRLHLEGRGFGHGVGLCQYGARTLARAGRGYREILEHYYPGALLRRVYPVAAP